MTLDLLGVSYSQDYIVMYPLSVMEIVDPYTPPRLIK